MRQQIIDFVTAVSSEGSPDFVPVEDRVAVFDNDGTLWSERPMAFQAMFAMEQFRKMTKRGASIVTPALQALMNGNIKGFVSKIRQAFLVLLNVTHKNISVDEYQKTIEDWVFKSVHPTKNRPYSEMIFVPMLELLDYLRENDFRIHIVSGGGASFIRVFAPELYGIPPQNVIGSQVRMEMVHQNGKVRIMLRPGLLIKNDKEEKVISIERFIGQHPILAVGNSDGDFAMLEWVTQREGRSLGILLHHTDDKREFAYDRNASIGALNRGLDEYQDRGWILIDMKNDWSRVYPE